jgi:hypothetical protein
MRKICTGAGSCNDRPHTLKFCHLPIQVFQESNEAGTPPAKLYAMHVPPFKDLLLKAPSSTYIVWCLTSVVLLKQACEENASNNSRVALDSLKCIIRLLGPFGLLLWCAKAHLLGTAVPRVGLGSHPHVDPYRPAITQVALVVHTSTTSISM